jgi:LysR family nitrogen assimilation transcriptional regulator
MYELLFERRGLSLDRLRSFLRVVDAGGIARAAPSAPTQQSQLSRQIGELEAFFGAPLLEKSDGRMVPTPIGARLAAHARWSFDGLESLVVEPKRARSIVRLGAGDALLHLLLLPRLKKLKRLGVGRALEIRAVAAGAILTELRDRRLDLAIIPAAPPPRPFVHRPIGRYRLALYAARAGFPKAPTFEIVVSAMPIALQSSEPEIEQALFEESDARGVTPRVVLRCETFPQAMRAVETGAFAAVLPTIARAMLPASEYVEIRAPFAGIGERDLSLVFDPRLERIRPQAVELADELASALA